MENLRTEKYSTKYCLAGTLHSLKEKRRKEAQKKLFINKVLKMVSNLHLFLFVLGEKYTEIIGTAYDVHATAKGKNATPIRRRQYRGRTWSKVKRLTFPVGNLQIHLYEMEERNRGWFWNDENNERIMHLLEPQIKTFESVCVLLAERIAEINTVTDSLGDAVKNLLALLRTAILKETFATREELPAEAEKDEEVVVPKAHAICGVSMRSWAMLGKVERIRQMLSTRNKIIAGLDYNQNQLPAAEAEPQPGPSHRYQTQSDQRSVSSSSISAAPTAEELAEADELTFLEYLNTLNTDCTQAYEWPIALGEPESDNDEDEDEDADELPQAGTSTAHGKPRIMSPPEGTVAIIDFVMDFEKMQSKIWDEIAEMSFDATTEVGSGSSKEEMHLQDDVLTQAINIANSLKENENFDTVDLDKKIGMAIICCNLILTMEKCTRALDNLMDHMNLELTKLYAVRECANDPPRPRCRPRRAGSWETAALDDVLSKFSGLSDLEEDET